MLNREKILFTQESQRSEALDFLKRPKKKRNKREYNDYQVPSCPWLLRTSEKDDSYFCTSYSSSRTLQQPLSLTSTPRVKSARRLNTELLIKTKAIVKDEVSIGKDIKPQAVSERNVVLKGMKTVCNNDTFKSTFFEFLSENNFLDSRLITLSPRSLTFEDYCLNRLEVLKEYISPMKVYEKYYNFNEQNEVLLKLKPFIIEVENQKRGIKIKSHLPLDFMVILAFCKYDEILFVLSQCLDFDESKVHISLNEKKLNTVLNSIHYFDAKKKIDFSKKFKFDYDLKFKWITDTGVFNITILCPSIVFTLVNKKISLKKHITPELFVKVLTDVKNWHNIIIDQLRQDKYFKIHFNNTIGKQNTYKVHLRKLVINIDKNYKKLEDNDIYAFDSPYMPFIYRDPKGMNHLLILQGYAIETNKVNKTIHNLNWKNSLAFLNLKDYINLEACVNKRTKLDEFGNIVFDSSWLTNLDNESIKLFSKSNFELKSPRNSFSLQEPRLTFLSFSNGKYNKQILIMTKEDLSTIVKFKDIIGLVDYFTSHISGILSRSMYEESI
jgi:hypothetical protein